MSILSNYPPHHLLTHSGILLSVLEPTPEMICIEDIAIGLSRECRFANQTTEAYTVAQHSVMVSSMVPEYLAMEALLHDATEAYFKDIPSPLKCVIPAYKELENNLMSVIARKFNLKYPMPKEVKIADTMALEFEWQTLMIDKKSDFCWTSEYAHWRFMLRFEKIILRMREVQRENP